MVSQYSRSDKDTEELILEQINKKQNKGDKVIPPFLTTVKSRGLGN
jgi:hypothetical protein